MVSLCVQRKDGGSSPTHTLHFALTSLGRLKEFVTTHHYSHTVPAGITDAFGAYWRNELAGAALYGYGPGNARQFWGFPQVLFRELVRLVVLDKVPSNVESLFLGWSLRQMHKLHPELLAAITFADPAHGHTGVIYRATNWRYLGQFKAHRGSGRGPYSPIPKHKFLYEFYR